MGVPCIDAEVCVLSEESGHIDVGLVWTLRAIACCLIHALNRVSKAAHRRVEVDRICMSCRGGNIRRGAKQALK